MLVILKPTHQCNLRCSYCYVNNVSKTEKKRFSLDFAKKIIDEIGKYASEKHIKNVTLLWHGGEPLLWGKKNFKSIFNYSKKLFEGTTIKVRHSIQTNLTLLDEEYINIFKQFDVSVGFSLDGYKEINDKTRYFNENFGSFDIIIEKIKLCKSLNFNISAIVVANSKNINYLNDIYYFMKENNISFKVNPIFKSGEAQNNFDEFGITPFEYQESMIELFDVWTSDNKTTINLSLFSEIASNLVTNKPSLCNFQIDCQKNTLSISPNGDVFPCGRFIDNNDYNFGNLKKDSLNEIMKNKSSFFGNHRINNIINNECSDCKYLKICYGGCMHDSVISKNNFIHKTYLCNAYKSIFEHIEKYLIKNNIEVNV